MIKNKPLLIGLILTIVLLGFLLIVPLAHQNTQLARLYEMDHCFKDKQIPCRWVSGMENFYGSPIFNYHPPLPYYFGELILFISKNLKFGLKVILAISLVGSYIFMYFLASQFLRKLKANLLATFYMLLVFTIIVLYSEGLGEAWGLMFFPIVLLSLKLLSQKMKIRHFLFSYVSLSLMIMSSDFALILIGLISIWIIYRYIREAQLTFLLLGFSSILFAFLLSSFYIFPSILEKNLVYSISVNNPLRYLPKSAAEKPQTAATAQYQILTGDSDVLNFKQGTNWLRFETNTKTHTIIRLSQVYFPDWKILIDGKETKVEYKNNSLGLMTIILGQGKHLVEGRLVDTPIRIISNIVTAVLIIFTLILGVIQFKGVRNWLNYYKKRVN